MSFIDTIVELENKLFNLHPEAKKIYGVITDLKDLVPLQSAPKSENRVIKLVFDKSAPASIQAQFALKYIGRVAKISEIEKSIKEFDPDFNKGLNTPLDKLKRAAIIDIYNPTGSNHSVYYGLKTWFNLDGTLKDEYKPTE